MADTTTDDPARDRELIEQALNEYSLLADAWETDEDNGCRPKVTLGRWVVVVDDEDRGLFEGDEGELYCTAVGGAAYHNLHAAFYFTPDEMETGDKVIPYEDVEPA